MNAIQASTDYSKLRNIINEAYQVGIDEIDLHRDMIGYVYFAKSQSRQYVLKQYRSFDTDNALRSIQIIQYLNKNAYPVVAIVPTTFGDTHLRIETPQGQSVAILFDYVEGTEPVVDREIEAIAQQVGRLHRLMKAYPQPTISRGKYFYVDRFLSILRALNYDSKRIDALDAYGSELWSRMELLPRGFCHGDLHTGNMLRTKPGQYTLFDFDAASHTHSIIDIATLCDGSDFNHLEEAAYERTLWRFDQFYQGYSQESKVNALEVAAIFDFIAIRHYEIIATITKCQGLQCLSKDFLDEQYEWLMQWKNICTRNRF